MTNVIKDIVKWQVDTGNADKPYDDFLESSFQVEEALEGFECIDQLAFALQMDSAYQSDADEVNHPKEVARWIVSAAQAGERGDVDYGGYANIPNVDRLDKACDAIVFAIGSMTKLGLDAHNITEALSIVNNANKQKLGMERDSEGKLLKPDNFVEPQVKLQALLDKIKS